MSFGAFEIILLVLAVLVLFGTGHIPVIMQNVGKGVKSFKKGLKDDAL